MKSTTILLLTLLSSTFYCSTGSNKNPKKNNKYLLLDSRNISSTINTKLEVGTVEKYKDNPLFGEDKEWEMRFDNFYGNVIFDEKEKLYKCWYSPFIVDSASHGMTLEQRKRKYTPPKNREMGICYATSEDGIKWKKPNLGLIEYNGSKQNNIVWRGPHGAGIFKDLHEKDPAKRFKMIFQGLYVSYSADGIHWSDKTKIKGVSVAGDTHNNAFWDQTLNKYVGITRVWSKKEGNKNREREVARIESNDFLNWTKEQVVLRGINNNLQPYSMPVFYYGGVYLGLVAIHNQKTDRVHTELTWSPDTEHWYRISPGTPLIPNSNKKLDYDYGCVYACAYPIIKGNEIMLYYGGSDWLHTGWRNGYLCLATLRIDGFAGYVQENQNQEGTITTKSLKFNGQDIKLTADVEKGGMIKVNILDKNGKKISDVETISSTITNGLLTMNKKIKEKQIRLEFKFANAKLYSFTLSSRSQEKVTPIQ